MPAQRVRAHSGATMCLFSVEVYTEQWWWLIGSPALLVSSSSLISLRIYIVFCENMKAPSLASYWLKTSSLFVTDVFYSF